MSRPADKDLFCVANIDQKLNKKYSCGTCWKIKTIIIPENWLKMWAQIDKMSLKNVEKWVVFTLSVTVATSFLGFFFFLCDCLAVLLIPVENFQLIFSMSYFWNIWKKFVLMRGKNRSGTLSRIKTLHTNW